MTNFEHITQDYGTLAEYLTDFIFADDACPNYSCDNCDGDCKSRLIEWLHAEYDNMLAPEPVLWDRKRKQNLKDSLFRVWAEKLGEEMSEFESALKVGDRERAAEELADCFTVLMSWGHNKGFTLAEINQAIEKVNEKNEARGALREH